jgi:hypothetical protein
MGDLYVNPEALQGLAGPYYSAGENYQHIGESYNALLPDFQEGFGKDDTGTRFYQQFIQAATELGLRVKNLEDAMTYCGEGLTQTGEIYGEAEDNAEQTAYELNANIGEPLTPTESHPKRTPLQATPAHSRQALRVVRSGDPEYRPATPAVVHQKRAVRSVHPGDPEYNTLQDADVRQEPAYDSRRAYSSVNPWQLAGITNSDLPYQPLAVTQLSPAEQAMAEGQRFSAVAPWELAGMEKPPPGMGPYQPLSMTQLPGQNGQPGMLVIRTPDGGLLGLQPPGQSNQGVTTNPQQGVVAQNQYAPGQNTEGTVTSPLVPDGNGNMVPAVGMAEPRLQRAELTFTPASPLPGTPPLVPDGHGNMVPAVGMAEPRLQRAELTFTPALPLPVTPPPDAVPGTPFLTVVVADVSAPTQNGVVVGEDRPPEVFIIPGVTPA